MGLAIKAGNASSNQLTTLPVLSDTSSDLPSASHVLALHHSITNSILHVASSSRQRNVDASRESVALVNTVCNAIAGDVERCHVVPGAIHIALDQEDCAAFGNKGGAV